MFTARYGLGIWPLHLERISPSSVDISQAKSASPCVKNSLKMKVSGPAVLAE